MKNLEIFGANPKKEIFNSFLEIFVVDKTISKTNKAKRKTENIAIDIGYLFLRNHFYHYIFV